MTPFLSTGLHTVFWNISQDCIHFHPKFWVLSCDIFCLKENADTLYFLFKALTCFEAKLVLLLAFIVVQRFDSDAFARFFIKRVWPSVGVTAWVQALPFIIWPLIGWVRLVLLIAAHAIRKGKHLDESWCCWHYMSIVFDCAVMLGNEWL